MIRIKNTLPPRLPSEYQEVEYIQSTSTQYINTGYTPGINAEFETQYMTLERQSYGPYVGGSVSLTIPFPRQTNNIFFGNNYGTQLSASHPYSSTAKYTVKGYPNGTAIINDTAYPCERGTKVPSGEFCLFTYGGDLANYSVYIGQVRIYYFKLWDNNELVRDMVPCYRKSDNVVGMYDLVEKKFYTNAGTGTFLIGNVVEGTARDLNINPIITVKNPNPDTTRLPSEYQEVEYIESTGTQHINTGYVVTKNTKVEFKISNSSTQPNEYPTLFGSQQKDNGTNRFGIGYTWNARTGPTNIGPSTAVKDTPLEGSLEVNKYILDEVTYTASDTSFTPATVPMFLFGCNVQTASDYSGMINALRGAMQLYYFKIYDNGTLIRDFIPCYRKSDNVAGLYDLVNNTFYTNVGTGTFTIGNEIIYQPILEYPLTRGYINGELFYGEEPPKYEQLVNYTMLYDLGDECTDITGGWVSKTDTSNASSNNTFTKNSDNLYQKGGTRTGGTTSWAGRWFTNNKIAFADTVKGFVAYTAVQSGTSNFNAPNVCIMSAINNGDSTPTAWVGGLAVSQSRTGKLLNITSALANNYVSIGYVRNGYYNMYGFGLLKQDNWQELCTIAGLNSSDYTDEQALCENSTAIATILASAEAVQFMIYQCTGSFMGRFIITPACLTALNNSPYYTKIQANEHWNKFLSMVA